MRQNSLSLLAGLGLWASTCSAVTLFAADSLGNVTTLSLTGSGHNYSLTVTARTAECEANPSWLGVDKASRVLYCLDRGVSTSTSGSLNSFSIGSDGALTRLDRVDAPLSGVAGGIITTHTGARACVSASYNRSAAAVYALGENGDLPGTGPVQQFFPTLNQTGPVASRQDRSYLHDVIFDPTNKYVVLMDLGGDLGRVYTYDENTVAPIVEVDGLVADPGTGPRHGVFHTLKNGKVFFFFNGELDQKVYSYHVKYTKTGLSFKKVFEIPSIDASLPATQAPTSEIALSPDKRFLVVSNREKSFRDSPILGSGPSDTLSTFKIKSDGTLERVQLAPSGGWSPRQFSFNKKGDMIAVGHQNNRTVVIWKRDIKSGKIISEEDGGKLGQVTLTGPVVATIWDE
ncbi:Lactonase, 7-bladed beta-propeller-domain-containing protein [Dactylonectria estremocensis]|uniref:Lactonase, 7-bladed beta-propeller-domain-containing protein n=1 Tax=Dactylonectria estremocensis TaxID=1079267 RepID=A0A9P9DQP0_9HYPO|nr:Lactonase, 7-bladed beta-propeller-domain-containing protein [Dactylonectria estremocensis]